MVRLVGEVGAEGRTFTHWIATRIATRQVSFGEVEATLETYLAGYLEAVGLTLPKLGASVASRVIPSGPAPDLETALVQ
jgi:hypothetical protein